MFNNNWWNTVKVWWSLVKTNFFRISRNRLYPRYLMSLTVCSSQLRRLDLRLARRPWWKSFTLFNLYRRSGRYGVVFDTLLSIQVLFTCFYACSNNDIHADCKILQTVLPSPSHYKAISALIDHILLRMIEEVEDLSDIALEESSHLNIICTMLYELERMFPKTEVSLCLSLTFSTTKLGSNVLFFHQLANW